MPTSYQTAGFAVAPVFEPAEIEALRADVTDHIDRIAHALHLPFANSRPQAGFAERLEQVARADASLANLLRVAICTDAHRGPRFQQIAEDGRLLAKASELAGVALGEPVIRLRANIPTLGRQRQGWHSDVARPDGGACSRIRIACWVPLMDAGPDSGGLEIAVGRRATPLDHDGNSFEIPEEALARHPRHAADCPMGSVLFLDRYTPHRALPNETDAARFALVMWLKEKDSPPS